jgi:hypothetical protein
VQSPQIPHKTEAGAVALGVQGAEAIARAYEEVLAAGRRHVPGAEIRGVLVQAMAPPGVEMLLGIHRDATFGPMLTVALGGIHVEALRDAALAPVPVSLEDAGKLLATLRARALLDNRDVDALVELMAALSRFAADHGAAYRVARFEPGDRAPRGQRRSVVDALIIKRQEHP